MADSDADAFRPHNLRLLLLRRQVKSGEVADSGCGVGRLRGGLRRLRASPHPPMSAHARRRLQLCLWEVGEWVVAGGEAELVVRGESRLALPRAGNDPRPRYALLRAGSTGALD
jgi:hypothetical protein